MTTDPVVVAIQKLGKASEPLLREPTSWIDMEFREVWQRNPSDPSQWMSSTPTTKSIHPRVLLNDLQRLAEWKSAVDALKADPILGKVTDRLVGDAFMASALQSSGLLDHALTVWFEPRHRVRRLASLVAGWRIEYAGTEIDLTTVTLAHGLALNRAIELSPQLTLRQMRDQEVATALSIGAINPMPGFAGVAFVDALACLAYTERMKRRIDSDVNQEEGQRYWRQMEVQSEAAVTAIRLAGLTSLKVGPRCRLQVAADSLGRALRWPSCLARLRFLGAPGGPAESPFHRFFARYTPKAVSPLRCADSINHTSHATSRIAS